jgi:hypothetical protein
VAGGEQHRRLGEDPLGARRGETGQPVADHRPRELEIAVLDRVGQPAAQPLDHRREFVGGVVVAASVAADHDRDVVQGSAPPVDGRAARVTK